MKSIVWHWVCLIALVAMPVFGCGSEGDGGGGIGGTAGTGGEAGTGGTAGTDRITPGVWTGEGSEGTGAPWTVCFSVNQAGDALVENAGACRGFAVDMTFGGDCPASYGQRPDIPIVDGSFRITEPGSYDIQGTFDGDSASGEATFTGGGIDCTAQWEASPSM